MEFVHSISLWHSNVNKKHFTVQKTIPMKTTNHPLRRLFAALLMPPSVKPYTKGFFSRNSALIHREESLNKIFMVRYRMHNL